MGFMPGAMDEYRPWLEEGFRRAGNGKSLKDFAIHASVHVEVDNDVKAALGQAEARGRALRRRHGPPQTRTSTTTSWCAAASAMRPSASRNSTSRGRKDEAIAAVPDEWVDMKSLVGPPARIRQRYRAWEDCGADTLNVRSRQPEAIEVDGAGSAAQLTRRHQ